MSLDHLKKQAKNAGELLDELFSTHPPPYTLAERQRLVARLAGYPSWHDAERAHGKRGDKPEDDPVADFYRYDWHRASLDINRLAGAASERDIHVVEIEAPQVYGALKELVAHRHNLVVQPAIIVNAAGRIGRDVHDRILNDEELIMQAGELSLSGLNHRRGTTIDLFKNLAPDQIAGAVSAILGTVASERQSECIDEVLRLLLAGGLIKDLPALQAAVSELICLSSDDFAERSDDDLWDLLGDAQDQWESAQRFLDRYRSHLSDLLRPLDACLTRLSVPGLDVTFSPRLAALRAEHRDECFPDWGHLPAINLVSLDFGNPMVDHLAALFVLIRIYGLSRTAPFITFGDRPAPMRVIIMTRPS